jgi:hypothetical protein
MERYYLGYVKDKIKINSNPTDSDFGLNEILIEKFFKLDFIEFRDGTCEKK